MGALTIGGVIAWIIANPATVAAGEGAVVDLVQRAIAIWQRSQQGTLTDQQLSDAWAAEGIDVAAAADLANKAGL